MWQASGRSTGGPPSSITRSLITLAPQRQRTKRRICKRPQISIAPPASTPSVELARLNCCEVLVAKAKKISTAMPSVSATSTRLML